MNILLSLGQSSSVEELNATIDTNINLKPCNGLEQLHRNKAKRRAGNIACIENDIGIIPFHILSEMVLPVLYHTLSRFAYDW